jgi:dTDP-4-dehydrorhamnose reductase
LRILLTGSTGQLGFELAARLADSGELRALDRAALDLANIDALRDNLRRAAADVIVNAAAYTAVDKAEAEPQLALRVNGLAPGVMAEEAKRSGALLVHFSTDYVFDGRGSAPYREDDPVAPLNAYGRSKLDGEQRIRASGCRHVIVRTAWLYGRGANFVRAILRQARKGASLRVVNDQLGAPTWAADVAAIVVRLLDANGVFHVTSAGQASWYEVAQEIVRLAGLPAELRPVTTEEYGAAAPRPRYSVLDNGRLRAAGIEPIGDWRDRLSAYLSAAQAGV